MPRDRRRKLPPTKETCFRLAYVLHKGGGQLSIARAAELLGDYFGLSDELLGAHESGPGVWTNFVRWARQQLNGDGFLEPVKVSGWGNWRLSEEGRELGRWAAAFYDDRSDDMPPWVTDFLSSIRKRIKGFLRGGGVAKPSDVELCRWVDLCYRLEMWSEGLEVFRRVLREKVPDGVYQTASRQARVCEHRVTEDSETDEQPANRPGQAPTSRGGDDAYESL